jgi:hypothetical protein
LTRINKPAPKQKLLEENMHVFCTYCSRDKSDEPNRIPAVQRYQSQRINRVYAAASQVGLEFFILSGEFGLLSAQQPIPWYDHLLLPKEVDELAARMAQQIQDRGISGVVYFTRSSTQDPNVQSYRDAMTAACKQASQPLFIIEQNMED